MYRALYDFESDSAQALVFHAGDQFTVLEQTDEHWWLAQNGFGQIGYVPHNYIDKDQVGLRWKNANNKPFTVALQ